jgi:DNA topoisomerase-1
MVREVSEHKCPVCGRDMIKRRGRFGEFLGCSGYSVKNEKGEPACSVIVNLDKQGNPLPPKPKPIPTGIKCEKCGGDMVLRGGKRGPWLGCASFPKCRAIVSVGKLEGEAKARVEQLLPVLQQESAEARAMAAKIAGVPVESAGAPSAPRSVPTDIDCEECGKPMVIRSGRRGPFLGCSGYPKCRHTMEVPAKLLEEMGLNGNGNGNGHQASPPAQKAEKPASPEDLESDLLLE